ncbi:MAG: hypothetical protein VB009_03635 [Erysipelotrichaceae bacterium]|nr:hypothetical protein [Erysipelotrichaceae bacterium]
MNDILMKILLVTAILLSITFVVFSIINYQKLKDKDFIFNMILALAIGVGASYFLLSDRWCYTCSVYNNYILYSGLVLIQLWMLYDLRKELRMKKNENKQD